MPYLCRMCNSECETDWCEDCNGPAVEVDELYKITLAYTCIHCLSTKEVKLDNDKRDALDFGYFELKRCPYCNAWRGHSIHMIKSEGKRNFEKELDKLYQQELKKGE